MDYRPGFWFRELFTPPHGGIFIRVVLANVSSRGAPQPDVREYKLHEAEAICKLAGQCSSIVLEWAAIDYLTNGLAVRFAKLGSARLSRQLKMGFDQSAFKKIDRVGRG
jgi:hypothetical protein